MENRIRVSVCGRRGWETEVFDGLDAVLEWYEKFKNEWKQEMEGTVFVEIESIRKDWFLLRTSVGHLYQGTFRYAGWKTYVGISTFRIEEGMEELWKTNLDAALETLVKEGSPSELSVLWKERVSRLSEFVSYVYEGAGEDVEDSGRTGPILSLADIKESS